MEYNRWQWRNLKLDRQDQLLKEVFIGVKKHTYVADIQRKIKQSSNQRQASESQKFQCLHYDWNFRVSEEFCSP